MGRALVVAGAKGGVGKSVIASAIGVASAAAGRVTILADTDLDLPTVTLGFDLFPAQTFDAVLRGECTAADALIETFGGLRVLPGAAATPDWRPELSRGLLTALADLPGLADLVIYDTGSRCDAPLQLVLQAADEILVVLTPDPAGLAGAFATLRAIGRHAPDTPVSLLVNQATNRDEAERYGEHLRRTMRKAIGRTLPIAGHILRDPHVREAHREKQQFLLTYPGCPASLALRRIAAERGWAASHGNGNGNGNASWFGRLLGRSGR